MGRPGTGLAGRLVGMPGRGAAGVPGDGGLDRRATISGRGGTTGRAAGCPARFGFAGGRSGLPPPPECADAGAAGAPGPAGRRWAGRRVGILRSALAPRDGLSVRPRHPAGTAGAGRKESVLVSEPVPVSPEWLSPLEPRGRQGARSEFRVWSKAAGAMGWTNVSVARDPPYFP